MKVLIALQYYLPHRTGLTLHVQRLAEGLVRRGHSVTVLCGRHDRSVPRCDELVNGVRVVRLWVPFYVTRGALMPAYPHAAWKLVREHDVVHVHTPMLETPIFALYTKLLRKGLVVTHHGDLVLPADRRFNRFVEWFTRGLHEAAAGAAHRILAYSEDYADHSKWIARFRDRTFAVYPPVEVAEPDPERARRLRTELLGAGAPPTARLLGYAGRFVEEKRPDLLIRALDRVREGFPGSKAAFAGQYEMGYERFFELQRPEIEARRDAIEFLGLIEDPAELAAFYAACDVLVLPSDTECMGLVQAEAMLCGTPVVCTDIPGAREVVRATGMGRLARKGDAGSIAEAIRAVLEDPAAHARTRDEIRAVFDLERTVGAVEEHLAAAARAARGARSAEEAAGGDRASSERDSHTAA